MPLLKLPKPVLRYANNNLTIIDTVLESTTRFIAIKRRTKTRKRAKIENIVMMLRSVINAVPKVCIMLNAPEARLTEILEVIALPTVSHRARRLGGYYRR